MMAPDAAPQVGAPRGGRRPRRRTHGVHTGALLAQPPGGVARLCWANLPLANAAASRRVRRVILLAALLLLGLAGARLAEAQANPEAVAGQPLTEVELARLVAPVALYPDDLLAVVLPASTFPLQVVLAARLLEARATDQNLAPDEEWDASVVALLNYPEVVALLDSDLRWTWKLGEAVLVQQADVIAAIADFREAAALAGNLKSDDRQIVAVNEAGAIEITPVEREVIHVPYYDPGEVTLYQPTRVYYYYPRAYPVYYYPYPSGHYFSNGAFWGVSSVFSIGWRTGRLHWHHHGFHDHPYFGFSYYEPFYYRRPHLWLSPYHQDRLRRHHRRHHADNRWHHGGRHGGHRPGHRPRRPGRENHPGGSGGRAPDGQGRVEVPGDAIVRTIDRAVVALPGKQSGHIPVTSMQATGGKFSNDGRPPANAGVKPGRSNARGRQPSRNADTRHRGPDGRRTTSLAALPSGTTAGARGRAPNARQRGVSRQAAVGTPRNRGRQQVARDRPTRAPARLARQRPAKPSATRQAPQVSSPIRKPARRQQPQATARNPRPASVKAPAQKMSSRPQPQQRRTGPGTGATGAARTTRPMAIDTSTAKAVAASTAARGLQQAPPRQPSIRGPQRRGQRPAPRQPARARP